MRRARGFSLLETIMAIAVLFASAGLLFPMYQAALSYGNRVDQMVLATTIARSKIADLQLQASQDSGGHMGFDTMTSSAATPDPTNPQYLVQVTVLNKALYSPCTTFEAVVAGDTRQFSNSYKQVEVNVSWNSGASPGALTVISYIGDPGRTLSSTAPIKMAGLSGSSPVPKNGTMTFAAQLYDQDNNPISDVTFLWSVVPQDGRGTVTQTRSGSVGTLSNYMRVFTGMITWTGGTCQVLSSAVYQGVETWAYSNDFVGPISLSKT